MTALTTPTAKRPARASELDAATVRRVIGERRLGDWVITDRARKRWRSARAGGNVARRVDEHSEVTVLVRRDLPSGRGTGVASTRDRSTAPRTLVAAAVARAESAIEAPWITPPAAAVAKVAVFDPALDVDTIAAQVIADAAAAGLEVPAIDVAVSYDDVTLVSAQGFSLTWRESLVELSATFAREQRRTHLHRRARRLAELDLPAGVADAAIVLRPGPSAPAPAGPVVLELTTDAMLGDDELGIWRALTSQCDATQSRRGLVRAAPGALLGAAEVPLEVWSDGALAFGLRSAPVGDEGEAVRRFALLMRGRLAELGMNPQEAALRKLQPNGGVRNVVVSPGAAGAAREQAPVLAVHRLSRLAIDPLTGIAEAELGYARDRDGAAITRGSFSIDLLRALASARRAPEVVRRGAYLGPRWITIGPLTLD